MGVRLVLATCLLKETPASSELKSCVSVEVLLNRGHADANGFLEQQFTVMSGRVNHCGLIPLDGMLVLPMHVQLLQTSPVSLSCRLLGALSTSSPTFFWSHRCRPYHNCKGFGTLPWTASPLVGGPSPGSALSGESVQT